MIFGTKPSHGGSNRTIAIGTYIHVHIVYRYDTIVHRCTHTIRDNIITIINIIVLFKGVSTNRIS